MSRVYALLAVLDVAFLIFAAVDVILTEKWRARGVPKVVWFFIVALISPIGGILWFWVGKEPADRSRPTRTIAPDDDAAFLNRMSREQDERIRRLEQELADLDDDDDEPKK
jgi:hypothetical protein